jgi:hypothetical protein
MHVTETEKRTLMIFIQLAPVLVTTATHRQSTNSLKKLTCGTESLSF